MSEGEANRPRLLFLVTEDWYFWAHRLLLARAARDAGYEVIVATRVDRLGERIAAEGFRLEPLDWVRGSLNPLRLARDIAMATRLYRRLQPDLVHHVSLRPVVVGSAAALLASRPARINALTGLGYVFTAPARPARMVAALLAPLLGRLLNRQQTVTILENREDQETVVTRFGVARQRTRVNRGSGVDLARFRPLPPPDNAVPVIGCAARMVAIKGIADLVEASRILIRRGVAHRLHLAGDPDPENPDSIPEATLARWAEEEHIDRLGHVEEMSGFWAKTDIAVLASHGGEGVPLSLVEAAACARPLIATDTPGCRDIVETWRNGLLVPPRQPELLADALALLLGDAAMRKRMGEASVDVVRSGFSSDAVNAATLGLYRDLLAETADGKERLDIAHSG
jgi:glycosyltransferase involved in cell wall biosynthesis